METQAVVGLLVLIGIGWLIWKVGPLALFGLGCAIVMIGVLAGGGGASILNSLVAVVMIVGGATLVGLGLILHELRRLVALQPGAKEPAKSSGSLFSKPGAIKSPPGQKPPGSQQINTEYR